MLVAAERRDITATELLNDPRDGGAMANHESSPRRIRCLANPRRKPVYCGRFDHLDRAVRAPRRWLGGLTGSDRLARIEVVNTGVRQETGQGLCAPLTIRVKRGIGFTGALRVARDKDGLRVR